MHASIQRFDQGTTPAEAVILAGKQRAAALQRLPGFVAYVLLEAGAGQLVSISLFEDTDGLQAATAVLALEAKGPGEPAPPAARLPWAACGEVLVQAGL